MFLISEIFGVKIIIIMETKRNLLIFFPKLIYHLFGYRLVGFCATPPTNEMLKDQNYWLHKLVTLRIDRARGNPAPHKPLLLLVIMEMAERGEISRDEGFFYPAIPRIGQNIPISTGIASDMVSQANS
jgi:hypothetical protein